MKKDIFKLLKKTSMKCKVPNTNPKLVKEYIQNEFLIELGIHPVLPSEIPYIKLKNIISYDLTLKIVEKRVCKLIEEYGAVTLMTHCWCSGTINIRKFFESRGYSVSIDEPMFSFFEYSTIRKRKEDK